MEDTQNNNDVAPEATGARLQAPVPSLHPAEASSADAPLNVGNSSDVARLILRALRGRYRLTLMLALLAGTIGAAIGWFWAGPLYRSEGMVRIASALPAVIQQTDQNQPIPMFESFMQAQQELVTSRNVLDKVAQ